MKITKNVEQEFETDVTVDVDPNDVLDEMGTEEIIEYLDKRKKEDLQYSKNDGNEKYFILMACKGHIPRNISPTNKDVKEAINNIIDMVFPS